MGLLHQKRKKKENIYIYTHTHAHISYIFTSKFHTAPFLTVKSAYSLLCEIDYWSISLWTRQTPVIFLIFQGWVWLHDLQTWVLVLYYQAFFTFGKPGSQMWKDPDGLSSRGVEHQQHKLNFNGNRDNLALLIFRLKVFLIYVKLDCISFLYDLFIRSNYLCIIKDILVPSL